MRIIVVVCVESVWRNGCGSWAAPVRFADEYFFYIGNGGGNGIFVGAEFVRHDFDFGVVAAIWSGAFACGVAGADASGGVSDCGSFVFCRVFCGQDSIRGYSVGCHSHLHSPAGSCVSCVCFDEFGGTGVAVGRGLAGWRSGADIAQREGIDAGGGECQPGTVQQLDVEYRGRFSGGVVDVDGQRASDRDGGGGWCATDFVGVFDFPSVPVCAARVSAIVYGLTGRASPLQTNSSRYVRGTACTQLALPAHDRERCGTTRPSLIGKQTREFHQL